MNGRPTLGNDAAPDPRDSPGRRPRALLAKQSHFGEFDDPAPAVPPPYNPAFHWLRWAFLPLSSVMRVQTDERVVALTYDDGPSAVQTPGVLDALAEHGARATFFVLTDQVTKNPDLLARLYADGHEVALHGIDHLRLTTVPALEAARLVREGRRRLLAATGRPVTMYRPTYGAQGFTQYLAARLSGMDVIFWSAWGYDWVEDTAQGVADRVLNGLQPGAIILLHDTTDDTREYTGPHPTFDRGEAARLILAGLAERGYRTATAGELLAQYPAVRALTTLRPRLTRRRRHGTA